MLEPEHESPHPALPAHPRLGIFEVRRELEPHISSIRGFEISVDLELAKAAETGSLDGLQRRLCGWLQAALVAKNPEGLKPVDIHERGRYVEELEREWEPQRAARPG